MQPAYLGVAAEGGLPLTERAAMRTLSLPMYPELTVNDIEQVVKAVRSFFED